MSKHTDGPWLYREKNEAVYTAPPEGSVYTYGEQIFRFNEDALPSDADHHLILAAPELLEAAKLVLAWYEAEEDFSKEPDFYKRVAMCKESEDAIRAAIAKATGEQA